MKHFYHGDTGTRLYRIWKGMKCRCTLQSHPTYKHYGARGIHISPEWFENYPNFRAWSLEHGYSDDLELDRIDVNGDYSPENCRWISHYEQTMNRSDTLYIAIKGRIERCRDFCKAHDINIHTFTNWRYLGIENQKLSEKLGTPVKVGYKSEVMPKCDC